MSELQSLTPETAFTVASTFLAYYYSEFVKLNELARMSDLYDERSYMTLVDFRDEVPVVAHGRNAVANLLAKLDSTLGQRKVEIITVDTVALPHNCVQVICQGVMYLREYRRVFLHVFMLEPTAYRTKTYHIASDYLRFVDSEKEVIPEGAVVIAADQVAAYLEESRRRVEEEQRRQLLEFQQRIRLQQQQLQMQQQQQQQKAAAMNMPAPASRQSRPAASASRDGGRPARGERKPREPRENRGERKPREPREPRGEHKPREGEEKVAAASPSRLAGEGKKGGERGNRKPAAAANAAKGTADTAAATPAPAAVRKPRRESGPTAAIIMLRVPKKIKLSDIKAELVSQGFSELKDLFWCGRDSAHAVVKFSTVEKATEAFETKPFKIQGESLNLDYYHE
ncbi:conserved hypothetical protein [Leishmania major strain Friedlin]|uniref:NTF2 domain-containing protein n=1 Tax=Leishmania major TaxID=5664 RepID=Q4QCH2_LEIMA|nr:conserved hypothetical protein [Leishmania major strain Friedlin]CAG9573313.1 hypothetical_protein_-_conserved [Leishmania major strain Friedlin]CAJ03990.1 conserved hypothetical protein [Leishmania major strain Friedlin]|eukprot:XP_001682976.1 conserved hypothetical protein [Leishmania major strain Friedlin]